MSWPRLASVSDFSEVESAHSSGRSHSRASTNAEKYTRAVPAVTFLRLRLTVRRSPGVAARGFS